MIQEKKEFFDFFNTQKNQHRVYDGKSFVERLRLMQLRVPNFRLPPDLDNYQIQHIKFNKGVFQKCRVEGWLTGYISIEFHFNRRIPNLSWHYNKFSVWCQAKIQLFLLNPVIKFLRRK